MPGLLYRITSVISTYGGTVTTALVDTLGSEVVDVFYLTAADGTALTGAVLGRLRNALTTALGSTGGTLGALRESG